jgi:hypothetical protein
MGEGITIDCVTVGRLKERKAMDAATVRFVCALLAVLLIGIIGIRRKKRAAE